jgi:hypothetical protein
VNKIIAASKTKPSLDKAIKEISDKRKEARKALAAELKVARNRLKEINTAIASKAELLSRMQRWNADKLVCIMENDAMLKQFPTPPEPNIDPSPDGVNLPDRSGIYFLWSQIGSMWVYVGKSVKLSQRLRLGNHHILSEEHRIAFIEFDVTDLDYAEIVYMAILRPTLNFGGRLLPRNA